MTAITGSVKDVTGVEDNDTPWSFASVIRFAEDGSVITEKPREVRAVSGNLKVNLVPGYAIVTYGKHKWQVTVPDTATTLKALIEAGVAFPPDTAQDLLNAAVAEIAPALVADELQAQTADAVDADLASRSIGFVDEGSGAGHFTVGGVPVSGTLVPPAAVWSGVAGKPTVASFAELVADTSVDSLTEGAKVHVRDGASYVVMPSGALADSVADYEATYFPVEPWEFRTPATNRYHVITGGGTKLRSVAPFACPKQFGAVGDGVTDDTAAVQMAALYAAYCGEFRPAAGVYLVSSPITYFGRVRHVGNKMVKFFAAADSNMDAVFVPLTWNTSSQVEMQSKQHEKFRPEFHGLEIDCNGDNNGANYGIILTSTEAKVMDNWIWNAKEYSVLLTPYNKLGHALDAGYNLLQNWICRNRLIGSLKGGFLAVDNGQSKTTDGWCCENSISLGSEWSISIDSAQGWKVLGNQTSGTLHGIQCIKTNNTVIANNVVHGFGDKTTTGTRYGIYIGGITAADGKAVCANNTVTAWANATAIAASSTYIGIRFSAGNSASKDAQINITGNALTFSSAGGAGTFAGTSTLVRGIWQASDGTNNFFGIIDGNTVMSDEAATGVASSFISLHATSRIRVGINCNGGQKVHGRGSFGASAATPDISTDMYDWYHLYALATTPDMTTDWTGTPIGGQRMSVLFTGTASRPITWGSNFTGRLLRATNGTNTHVQELVYVAEGANAGKWVGIHADPIWGTGTLDFGSVSAQSHADLTITVTGAVAGDSVALGVPTTAVTAGIVYSAWVSAANTVTVRAHNYTGSPVDPASGTFKATIV